MEVVRKIRKKVKGLVGRWKKDQKAAKRSGYKMEER